MPKHIVTLLLILGCFLLLAFIAKIYLTDPSFYRFGDYRADAVPELAAGSPVYKGTAYCQTCHSDGFAVGTNSAHGAVQCEVCHGADPEHPDNPRTLIPVDTVELCTVCHEAMPARPASQPQIVVAEHPFPDEAGQQCHTCHDPHSPAEGEAVAPAPDVETQVATIPPPNLVAAVSKCAKCHGSRGEGKKKNPPLAGLESSVFIDRMNMYISGVREHQKMAKYAKELSAEEIVEIADYYEGLPTSPPE